MFHLFSIHDIKKEFQTIFQGFSMLCTFAEGGWKLDLFFFHKENVLDKGGQMHSKFIMYLYNVGMVGCFMSHPETPYQVLCGDMSRKVP